MKVAIFAAVFLIAACAPPSQPYRSGPGTYSGRGNTSSSETSGMTGGSRPTSRLSQDATDCERKAILAGPGGKAAAFDSCMRARGHATSR